MPFDFIQYCFAPERKTIINFEAFETKCQLDPNGFLTCWPAVSQFDTPSVIISIGVHGNETAPIEMLNEIINAIVSKEYPIKVPCLFIFANPKAAQLDKRFVSTNLNRLFTLDTHQLEQENEIADNEETSRAKLIKSVCRQFYQRHQKISPHNVIWHFDLHTAIRDSKFEKFAIFPSKSKQHNSAVKAIDFLAQSGIEHFIINDQPSNTMSYYTHHQFSMHSFTIELGKARPFGQNKQVNISLLKCNLEQLLQGELLSLSNIPVKYYEIAQTIIKRTDQFKFNFAENIENFSYFYKGSILAEDTNARYYCLSEREAIVFPNDRVEIGHRALLTVVETNKKQ